MTLILNGTDNSATVPAVQGGTAGTSTGLYYPSTNQVAISTAGTQAVFVNASQQVGIGTSSPSYKLDVVGTGDLANRVSTTGTSNAASIILQSGSGTTSGLFAYARFLNNDTNAQDWRIGTYGTNNLSIVNAKAGTVPVTVDTSGNLGIGTSSPNQKLDVAGSMNLSASGVIGWGGSQNYFIQSDNANWLRFGTAGSERARIDSSGNLLVGTTSAGGAGGVTIYPLGGGAGSCATQVFNKSNTTSDSAIQFRVGGSTVSGISYTSTLVTYGTVSDYRAKNVIGSVIGSGERIDALEPIEYEWKIDGSRAHGFLAHKFQEVYPNSVTGTKDAVDAEGKPVYQGMQASTSEVIADLVAEIQSLRKRLAALESR